MFIGAAFGDGSEDDENLKERDLRGLGEELFGKERTDNLVNFCAKVKRVLCCRCGSRRSSTRQQSRGVCKDGADGKHDKSSVSPLKGGLAANK